MGHHPSISESVVQASASGGFSGLDLVLIIIVVAAVGGWIYYSIKVSKDGKGKT